MKRFIYSIGVFLFSQLLLSCNSCGCKRTDNHVPAHFDIRDMYIGFSDRPINPYEQSNNDTSLNNFSILQDSAIIESNKFALLVIFNINFVAKNKQILNNFSVINSAYACSPIEIGQDGSREAIDSFYVVPLGRLGNDSIFTDTLFTLNHANTIFVHLNDTLIEMSGTKNNGGIGSGSNYAFISKTKIYFNFYNSFINFYTDSFIRFKVVLKLKNGERYEQMTKYIKLI